MLTMLRRLSCDGSEAGRSIRVPSFVRAGIAAAAVLAATPAIASTIQLLPVDDTFAYSGEPDTAHGALSGLATGFTWPHPEAGWVTYLKFDLSGIPSSERITGATLHLYKFIVGAGFASLGTNLFHMAPDEWSESTLTWNNQPLGLNSIGAPNFGTPISSNSDGFAYVGWSTWDLFALSAWDAAADQADGLVSLQLAETYGGDQSHNWCSKETDPTNCPAGAMFQPYLEVTTTPVPSPSAGWLTAAALLALAVRARAGRRAEADHARA
jgi:hypothetical protein